MDTIKMISQHVFGKCLFIAALPEPEMNAHMILSASITMPCFMSGLKPKHSVLLHPTTFTLISPKTTAQETSLKGSHSFWMNNLVLGFCPTLIKSSALLPQNNFFRYGDLWHLLKPSVEIAYVEVLDENTVCPRHIVMLFLSRARAGVNPSAHPCLGCSLRG